MTTDIERGAGGGPSSVGSDSEKVANTGLFEAAQINRVRERELLRKLDLHLIPIIMILYLLSFLDRGNIHSILFTFLHPLTLPS